MTGKKDYLEVKLNANESVITKETNLSEFSRIMWQDYKASKTKTKEQGLRRAYSMLGYLYRGKLPYGLTCSRGPIHTIGELYSFTKEDLRGISCYQGKTWKSLSKHLVKYSLPSLKLPQEWTQEP